MARTQFAQEQLLPVGRVVRGNFYKARDKDSDGVLYTFKDGPKVGQPNPQFFFALALPKTQVMWQHEPWGKLIWSIGNQCFPKIAESPTFSWKITDGDSAVPNSKGNKPCNNEGYPGNWIISFNSSLAPRLVSADGSAYLLEPNVVMAGDYVQVLTLIDGNQSNKKPGVYINSQYVSFKGYSAKGRIEQGRDPASIEWDNLGAPTDMVATLGSAPVANLPQGTLVGTARAPVAVPTVTMPAPTAVVPSPGFLAPPVALPPPPMRQMTAKAQGNTYEGMIAQGWNDGLLVQHGMMVA